MFGQVQTDGSHYTVKPGDAISSVLLLFSGGLDTSCLIPFIRQEYNCEVHTLTVDLGQRRDDLRLIEHKALHLGADTHVTVDAKEQLLRQYVLPAVLANARIGEGGHPLSSSLTRPLIAQIAVDTATSKDIQVIAHGSSAGSNDGVRFETYLLALMPRVRILAPVRDRAMTREDQLSYASRLGIDVDATIDRPYSVDDNLWGMEIEAGDLDDLKTEPGPGTYFTTRPVTMAPNTPEDIRLEISAGMPVALNGAALPNVELIRKLNQIGATHSVGRHDRLEDRAVGFKVREIHEAPAAQILYTAVDDMLSCTLTPTALRLRRLLGYEWTQLMLWGQGLDPSVEGINKFFESIASYATGSCVARLYKGSCVIVSREYPSSLDRLGLTHRGLVTPGEYTSCIPGYIEVSTLALRAARSLSR